MATWMWGFCVTALVGVWLGPAWSGGPPWLAMAALPVLARLPGLGYWRWPVAALAGYLFAMLALGEGLAQRLPRQASGSEQLVKGRVVGLPQLQRGGRGQARQRFQLQTTATDHGPRRLSLTWYQPGQPLRPGEQVRLRARLYAPRARLNEAGFDRARHDLAAGVDAHGYVRELIERDGDSGGMDARRQAISAELRRRLADYPVARRWLPALVTGDRRHLTEADWRLLRGTGTVHLMAISGLHITLVAGLAWWLFRWLPPLLWQRWSPLAAQQLAVVPALLAAAGYAWLAGLSLPTQRALVMSALVFAGLLSGRRRGRGWVLAVALIGVLAWHPLAPLASGFWLSFGAVTLLMLVVSAGWRGMLRAQWLLGLGLGAITAWWFGDWGALAPVANLVLIPLFSLLVVPLALLVALTPVPGLLSPLGQLMEGIHAGLAVLVTLAPQVPPVTGLLPALCILLALLLLTMPGTLLPRWVAPFLLLPWLLPSVSAPQPGQFRLVVFDVGQAQAMAIRTHRSVVLYDLGPRWSGGNAGDSLLVPWLRRQGASLELVFASHGDGDHAGGLAGLKEQIPAGRLFSGEPDRLPGAHSCLRGQSWRLDGVHFEVLWPAAGIRLNNSNNRSCVIRVSSAAGRVLLTGDIEKPVEYWLARRGELSADVLQVPHHGSTSSSSYTLLRAVRPGRAFVSAGHLNAFNHPAPEVRQRYRKLGVPLDVTANTGMIVFAVDGQHNAAPRRWRASRYRPWRAVVE